MRPSAFQQQPAFNAESCGSDECVAFLSFVSLISLFLLLFICVVCVYIYIFVFILFVVFGCFFSLLLLTEDHEILYCFYLRVKYDL